MVAFFIPLQRTEKMRVGREQSSTHSGHEAICGPLWSLTDHPPLPESPMLPKVYPSPSPLILTRCCEYTSHRCAAWEGWLWPWRWAKKPEGLANWAQRQVCHLGGAEDRRMRAAWPPQRSPAVLNGIFMTFLARTLPHLLPKVHFHMDC